MVERKSDDPKRVLIVQRRLTHYRIPFFNALRHKLANDGVDLNVAYGTASEDELTKSDGGSLPWATELRTTYLLGGRICWQPVPKGLGGIDLLIVTHENKLLWNLWAQFANRENKVALWGHGANFQGAPDSFREAFKRRTARRADWWFGYTELSRPEIVRSGFPAERITIVENSIDTLGLAEHYCEAVRRQALHRANSADTPERRVGAYIGSLYKEKRISFLLEAAVAIKARVPDFELVIAGAGSDQSYVEEYAAKFTWITFVGMIGTAQKATILADSRVLLNPGLVGLGILDSFVCETPMVTTSCGLHSPEVAYLENEVNGVMTDDSIECFVEGAVQVLCNDATHARLKAGCANSAGKYTVENMACEFAKGIVKCLQLPAVRSSL